MAIVEMKRIRLLGMAADKDMLLRVMQRFGCVQITEPEGDMEAYLGKDGAALEASTDQLQRIRAAISQLGRYDTAKGSMLDSLRMPEADAQQTASTAADEAALMAVVEAVEAADRREGDLRGQETRIGAQMDQLLPWRMLDLPVEDIRDTRDTVQFVGTVSQRNLPALETALDALPVSLEPVGSEREHAMIWAVAHRSARAETLEALKAADYTTMTFTERHGTVAQMLDALRAQAEQVQAERRALEATLREMSQEIPRLKILYEIIALRVDREQAAARFARTESTFLMEGWVPAASAEKLVKKLQGASPDAVMEVRDARADEKPPTLLRNNRIVAPFESIVASFSLPDPRGIDPTAIMMPFFACLFGMMVSDAGYGLVLAIGIPIIIHFVKPKRSTRNLMWVLAIGGIGTVFWGAMYDGWFGESLRPMLISPLEQPLEMMMLCLAVGAIHLFSGLGVGAYMNFKRGKPLDALYDQFSWFALIVGLALLLLPAMRTVGMVLAIVGALLIVLMRGRDKPSWPKRILNGLGGLYDITSWLSDLLSYMRLFGMGLATGVIGMVVNILAGMMFGKNIVFAIAGVAVLIIGHVFNAFINILGAYVHACRLQYIEFFGKFYEDGGIPFAPLAPNPRYIAIREASADGVEE